MNPLYTPTNAWRSTAFSFKFQKIVSCCFLVLLFIFPNLAESQNILINEFMASNGSTIADANGGFDDWVELYNPGNTAIDLSGYYISDNASNLTKAQFSNNANALTIEPGGFLLLWFDQEPLQGPTHIDLKLGAGGEDIVLTAPDATTILDSYTFGPQTADLSEGRTTNGGSAWGFFGTPTPGASNGMPSGSDRAATPVADNAGGLYNNTITVSLSSATPNAVIHYTLDGSIPSENAPLYTSPINISAITPLRAVAFANGLLPSKIMTESYLMDISHEFAIIALNVEPDFLFDTEIGIFGNPAGGNEHPAHVQFFEPDGSLGFSQDIELEIQGTASQTLGQKSLKMKAKASLGEEFFNYAVFPDLPFEKYRSLLIRQSGQDWKKSNFRDAMMQSLVGDLSDIGTIVDEPDLDLQGYRPSVVYINGEYWGIYNVREQMSWKFLDTHYDLNEDETYIAERKSGPIYGDIEPYESFETYLENNSFTSEVDYQNLKEQLDVSNYMDYMFHGIFIDNNDWPGNNSKAWRERDADGQWRFFTKDLDFGFGLRPLNSTWNSGDFTTDMLAVTLAENSTEYYNKPKATLMFRRLMENENARTTFFNRSADLMNTVFEPSRLIGRIDDFEDRYTPEMQMHLDRWNGGWNQHAQEVNVLRTFANGRQGAVREHFVNNFSEITGLTNVTLSANPTNGGDLYFSTLNLTEAAFPWAGTYFRNIDIPVIAKAKRGQVLTSWSDASLGTETSVTVNYTSATNNLTANFNLGSTATDPIVINEINYNSPDFPNSGDWIELYNPNNTAVDISGWYLEDESGDYFGLPANTVMPSGGYLLLAEDRESFMGTYPSAQIVYGGFGNDPGGFKLSNGGEGITLKNANGILIDEVTYDDNTPWPTPPDGDGPTLQLISPTLDNMLAESWMSFPATPGSLNGETPAVQDQVILFPEIADKYTFASSFDLGATSTSGLPVSYTLISGPASISNNMITLDGVPGIVVVQANQSGNANYHAANPVQQNFSILIFEDAPEGYCESEGSAPWQEWISNVSFGNINHDSGKNRYADFTAVGTYVTQGDNIPMSITPDYSWQSYDNYFRVWIDFNQDGDFEDAGEVVFSESNNSFEPVTNNITIPETATPGITRMRVSMKRDAFAEPCELFERGEVEDYTIIVEKLEGTNNGFLTLNCPGNIEVTAAVGETSISVNWNEPSVLSTCPLGNAVVSLAPGTIPNGGVFPLGTTSINYQAVDDCENMASCSFTVTVVGDNGLLSIDCPENIIIDGVPGANSAIVNWSEPVATTTCPSGGASAMLTTNSIPNGGEFPIGTTTVSYEATDDCGNNITCSFTVKVNGLEPIITIGCPDDITILLPIGTSSQVVNWDIPTASSNCPNGTIVVEQINGFTSGSVFTAGDYNIVYEATDDCGGTATCAFNITITEETITTLTLDCPSDINILIPVGQSSVVVNWPLPVVESTCQSGTGNPNCGGDLLGFDLIGTYNQHEYYISQIQDHWDDGKAAAAQFDAKLASISDQAENDFIQNNTPNSAFVGLNDESTEGTLAWDDGTAVGYTNFTSTSSNTSSRDYVKIQASDGRWKWHSANYKRYYIMELDCAGGANTTLTQTAGPGNGAALSPGTYTVTYEATDACGDVAVCSFTITITPEEGNGEYCESEASAPWQQHISQVAFNTFDHPSGKDGYGDFTTVSTTVDPGGTYDFMLTPKFSWTQFDEYIRVWIDYNQDGDFLDAGELVLETTSIAGTPNYPPTAVNIVNSTITIPENAIAGSTRMRVSMQQDAFPAPCDLFTFGEVEDYTVVVSSSFNLVGEADFLYFNALKTNRTVQLNWVTNTEDRNDSFVLERANEAGTFETIVEVKSTYNTTGEFNYVQEDSSPVEGKNRYRLKQIYKDGSYRYAAERAVDFDLALENFEVFPIPTEGLFFVNLKSFIGERAEVAIYNSYGQPVFQQDVDVTAALLEFDLSDEVAGVYVLAVRMEGRKLLVRRIVVGR